MEAGALIYRSPATCQTCVGVAGLRSNGFNFMGYINAPSFPGEEMEMGPDLFDS